MYQPRKSAQDVAEYLHLEGWRLVANLARLVSSTVLSKPKSNHRFGICSFSLPSSVRETEDTLGIGTAWFTSSDRGTGDAWALRSPQGKWFLEVQSHYRAIGCLETMWTISH
jgi:hypothetical protein